MYRSTPTACVACGEFVTLPEADVAEAGLQCWRCSARSEVEQHHDLVRTRVRPWVRLARRGGVAVSTATAIGAALTGHLLVAVAAVAVTAFAFSLPRAAGTAGS